MLIAPTGLMTRQPGIIYPQLAVLAAARLTCNPEAAALHQTPATDERQALLRRSPSRPAPRSMRHMQNGTPLENVTVAHLG